MYITLNTSGCGINIAFFLHSGVRYGNILISTLSVQLYLCGQGVTCVFSLLFLSTKARCCIFIALPFVTFNFIIFIFSFLFTTCTARRNNSIHLFSLLHTWWGWGCNILILFCGPGSRKCIGILPFLLFCSGRLDLNELEGS